MDTLISILEIVCTTSVDLATIFGVVYVLSGVRVKSYSLEEDKH